MARKYFEQMLLDELEIGRATSFPRWYAPANPVYYGLCDFHQDFPNIARVNRQDLYSIEYYRQPFLMPQTLLFPNYEPVYFIKRNNNRFPTGRNYITKDKRSSTQKKIYRQDDVHNCKGERGKPLDFQSQFERRYQKSCNREEARYPIPREERNAAYIAFRSSNFDLCPENMTMEQHMHNVKQMVESRNPSLERLSVHENLPQTGYRRNENVMEADSQNKFHKASELEHYNQANESSKNAEFSEFPASQNFHNSNESWYCPEEQQQIVDMLKEVNLRHDRQLKRDLLLSQSGQFASNELTCSHNDSQTSLSSDENEDNINILLYPGGIPPILQPEVDESFKPEHFNTSASDFFEEFQNIFTSSPERKIINEMIKETSKNSQTLEDDDLENTGREITDDDKNAVRAILNFDLVDDAIEMAFDNTENMTNIKNEVKSDALGNKYPMPNSESQNFNVNEECPSDMEINDSGIISDSDSLTKVKNGSTSSSYSDVVESNDTCSLLSSKHHGNNTEFRRYSPASKNKMSEVATLNEFFNRNKHINEDYYKTPSQNDKDPYHHSNQKTKRDLKTTAGEFPILQFGQKITSKEACNNTKLNVKLHKEESKYRSNASECMSENSPSLNKSKILRSNSSDGGSTPKDLCGIRIKEEATVFKGTNKTNVKSLTSSTISNETFRKEDHGLSLSDPFLTPRMNDVGYKRISISEIFSNVNTVPENENQKTSKHLETTVNLQTNVKILSPTEHLKLILGIGQCNDNSKAQVQINSCNSANKAKSNIRLENLKTYSMPENSKNMFKTSQGEASSNFPEKFATLKDNHSKDHPTTKSFDLSTNCKNANKYKTKDSNSYKSIKENNTHNNLPNILISNKCIQDPMLKYKKKQKHRKGNESKETSPGNVTPAIHISLSQANVGKIPEKMLKSKQKLTLDEKINNCKLFQDSKSLNECFENENSRKISELDDLNSKPKCSDKIINDNVVPMDIEYSNDVIKSEKRFKEISAILNCEDTASSITNIVSTCSDNFKSIRNNELVLDDKYPSVSSDTAKNTGCALSGTHYSQKYSNCHITDLRNIYNKIEADITPNTVLQSRDCEKDKLRKFVDSKLDSAERHSTYEKYYYQQKLSRNSEFSNCRNTRHNYNEKEDVIAQNAVLQTRNSEQNKLRTSVDSKLLSSEGLSNYEKYSSHQTPSKDSETCLNGDDTNLPLNIETNDKTVSLDKKAKLEALKTKRKLKKKKKEKRIDKYKNHSISSKHDQTQKECSMNNSSKGIFNKNDDCEKSDKVTTEGSQEEKLMTSKSDFYNSKRNSSNLCPNFELEAKRRYSENNRNSDSIVSFNNKVPEFNFGKQAPKFNVHAATSKESNLYLEYKNQKLKNYKTINVSCDDEDKQALKFNDHATNSNKNLSSLNYVNVCSNSELDTKRRYSEKNRNSDCNASFDNESPEFNSNDHAPKFNDLPANSKENNLCLKSVNQCPNSELEAKKRHFQNNRNSDSTVSFRNEDPNLNSDKQAQNFNDHAANSKENKSSLESKNQNFKNYKTVNFFCINESEQFQEKIIPDFTRCSEQAKVLAMNKVDNHHHVSLIEDATGKSTHLENGKNTFLEKSILHCIENEFLKNSNYTTRNNSSSESGSAIFRYNKESEYCHEKGHHKNKEHNFEPCIYSNETENKTFTDKEESRRKDKTDHGCTSSKVFNNKTDGEFCCDENSAVLRNILREIFAEIENISRSRKSKFSPEKNIQMHCCEVNSDLDDIFLFGSQNVNSSKSAIEDHKRKSRKEIQKVKFDTFLKNFIFSNHQRARNKMSNSPVFKSSSFKQPITNFPLTVNPGVMDMYVKNIKFLKMDPSFDLHVHFYIADFFSQFEFARLNAEFENGVELSLKSIIEKNLLHVLPVVLKVLSTLSSTRLHDNFKKSVNLYNPVKNAKSLKFWTSYTKDPTIQNFTDEVLKCWDVLSSSIDKRKFHA